MLYLLWFRSGEWFITIIWSKFCFRLTSTRRNFFPIYFEVILFTPPERKFIPLKKRDLIHYHKTKNGVAATAQSDKGDKQSQQKPEFSLSVRSRTAPENSVGWNAIRVNLLLHFIFFIIWFPELISKWTPSSINLSILPWYQYRSYRKWEDVTVIFCYLHSFQDEIKMTLPTGKLIPNVWVKIIQKLFTYIWLFIQYIKYKKRIHYEQICTKKRTHYEQICTTTKLWHRICSQTLLFQRISKQWLLGSNGFLFNFSPAGVPQPGGYSFECDCVHRVARDGTLLHLKGEREKQFIHHLLELQ